MSDFRWQDLDESHTKKSTFYFSMHGSFLHSLWSGSLMISQLWPWSNSPFLRDAFVATLHLKWSKWAPRATNKTAVNNSFYGEFELLGKDRTMEATTPGQDATVYPTWLQCIIQSALYLKCLSDVIQIYSVYSCDPLYSAFPIAISLYPLMSFTSLLEAK